MNKTTRHTLVAILTALLLAPLGATQATEFHVATSGNDAGPGTRAQPFATLERARDAVRALKVERGGKLPPDGVTVWLRGGRYELARTFILGPEDSGQDGAPIVYRAHPGETPILSGGRVIGGWRKVPEDPPGLPVAAKGKVWAAEIPAARDGKWPFRQLWKNGRQLTRARWPNEEIATFRVLDANLPSAETLRDPAAIEQWKRTVRQAWRIVEFRDASAFPGGSLPADLANGSAELFCRNGGRWATMRIPVAAAEGTRLRLAEPAGLLSHYWGGMRLMSAVDGRGHIENALALLDQPGEWYLDRQAGRVYYLPPVGEDPNACELVAARVEQLVWLRGTSDEPIWHVELRGVAFEHAEWPLPAYGYRPGLGCFYGTEHTPLVANPPVQPGSIRPKDEFPEYSIPAAVDLSYARHCRLESCRVSRVGASGIGLGEGCAQNQVVGCEVFDAGGHGIHVGLPHGPICAEDFAWKRPEDEPQANEVRSCYVHHTAQMDWGAYGILNSYANRTRIAHNLVEQQPYCAMAVCFSWFAFPTGRDLEVTVEHNHIHHVLLKLFDGGAIYTKDGVAKSSVIRGNQIHDVGAGDWENNGLFLDDGSYGFHITDNIIYHVGTPVRFNQTSKEKFTWGTNYFGAKDEKIQYIGHGGGTIAFGENPLPVEDAPQALKAKAGPEQPYRIQWPGAEGLSGRDAGQTKTQP